MRVLLLTEAFPPAGMVGAYRAAKIVAALRSRGHSVHVLTANGGIDAVRTGLIVQRLALRRTPRQWLNEVYGRWRLKGLFRGGPAVGATHEARTHSLVWRLLLGILWLPDDQQTIIPAAYVAGRRAHADAAFDLLYSTAPAFSMHIAGLLLARATGCPWVAEFRDPWTDNGAHRFPSGTTLTRGVDRALERAVLRRADMVVTNSERAADLFRSKLDGAHAESVLCALNGIAQIREGRTPSTGGALRLVYAGNLYPPRDPFPLLAALAQIRTEPETPPFTVEFVGHCAAYGDRDVAADLAAMGLADVVQLVPYLPPEDAQRRVESADLLLLPAQGWTLQVPNKLFDYLGSRVPILAIAEPGSETVDMLREAGGHYIITTDGIDSLIPSMRAALHAAVTRPTVGNREVLEGWAVKPQMDILVAGMENLMQSRRSRKMTRSANLDGRRTTPSWPWRN
jgi:glycosyltransferase involved in cell wall biosynthesis